VRILLVEDNLRFGGTPKTLFGYIWTAF